MIFEEFSTKIQRKPYSLKILQKSCFFLLTRELVGGWIYVQAFPVLSSP